VNPRAVVAVIYAEATAPVVRAQTPPLLRALRKAGRRVDAAVFTSPRALLVPSLRSSHARALAAFAEATGVEPMKRTYLPRDRGLETLGHALAKMLVKRGYRFVTLDAAVSDPAYASQDTFTGAGGISWIHRWVLTRDGRGAVLPEEPEVPRWVMDAAGVSSE